MTSILFTDNLITYTKYLQTILGFSANYQENKFNMSFSGIFLSNFITDYYYMTDPTPKASFTMYAGYEGFFQGKLNIALQANLYMNSKIQNNILVGNNNVKATYFLPNAKISYKIWKNNSLYFNARNIGSNDTQIIYAENIKGLYLVGAEINF
jgi:hypothetical protein